ncbi:MAG: carboxypeptidase-like regulatory domain-containing protein [Candidatus Marinimicrobia bacterium]|nr:carboxypeptidase-like regulatory domain-containing protein [Candidatus Neomarinimicrobiota bacterium]
MLFARTGFSLRGVVTDAETGEDLIGAAVSIEDLATGSFTNAYGFYSVTLPPGEHTVVYSFIGYEAQVKKIDLRENTLLNVELSPAPISLEEVMVSAERKDKSLTSARMSIANLNIKDISMMPVLFGEADILEDHSAPPGDQHPLGGKYRFQCARRSQRRKSHSP